MNGTDTARPVVVAALVLGFLALAAGIRTAAATPATGYELSIYRSTPTAFWAGIGTALVLAVAVLVGVDGRGRAGDAAVGLAGLGGISIVAIPLFRSYYFYGSGDSMSHLGWARELWTGAIPPTDVVYPGIHLLSVQLAALMGVPIRVAIGIVTLVVFPAAFVAAFTACAGYLTGRRRVVALAVIAAVMFVPINKVSVHVVAHPSSQAILLLPVLLLALFAFVESDRGGFALTTPTGGLLLLVSGTYVLVHPQESLTYLSMLGGIAVAQFVARRYRPDHAFASLRSLYAHVVVVGTVFVGWTLSHERARGRFRSVFESLLSGQPDTLSEASQRGGSLVDLGGSLVELYLKLFGVTTIVAVVAALLVGALLLGRLDPVQRRRNGFVAVLTVALVLPMVGFVAIFLASQGDHYFRFHGFIMVSVTLLAVLGVAAVIDAVEARPKTMLSARNARALLVVVLVVALAAQALVVHQSPYIYQSNKQVTETQMEGHALAFQHYDGETPMIGVRSGPQRFIDAHFGTETAAAMDFPGYRSGVPEPVFNTNVTTHYEEDRYLIVTDRDKEREVTLYGGFRYEATGFESLDKRPRSSRIQDNGDFRLYRLAGSE